MASKINTAAEQATALKRRLISYEPVVAAALHSAPWHVPPIGSWRWRIFGQLRARGIIYESDIVLVASNLALLSPTAGCDRRFWLLTWFATRAKENEAHRLGMVRLRIEQAIWHWADRGREPANILAMALDINEAGEVFTRDDVEQIVKEELRAYAAVMARNGHGRAA